MAFLMVIFIFPFIVLLASIIGFLLVKSWFVIPVLTFIIFTILTFTAFNESFFGWAVAYTIFSVIVSLIMKLIKQ
ncbi:putative membrane protein [Bacillus mesophilus]|uniref:DUF2651 domain-containing protein n=1 Tax=Bacillus mesophilus TaxID=1808955 RepID=A0A6M0Q4S1_9BACI|nr:DUF2651 family protein [Bacillus mesophilus]MBM7661090.1 putative membrane protein [Bacillus mesophilus]NEY71377.1 DUF2651 domain-containing protein [Bacillus mesophilus]